MTEEGEGKQPLSRTATPLPVCTRAQVSEKGHLNRTSSNSGGHLALRVEGEKKRRTILASRDASSDYHTVERRRMTLRDDRMKRDRFDGQDIRSRITNTSEYRIRWDLEGRKKIVKKKLVLFAIDGRMASKGRGLSWIWYYR